MIVFFSVPLLIGAGIAAILCPLLKSRRWVTFFIPFCGALAAGVLTVLLTYQGLLVSRLFWKGDSMGMPYTEQALWVFCFASLAGFCSSLGLVLLNNRLILSRSRRSPDAIAASA